MQQQQQLNIREIVTKPPQTEKRTIIWKIKDFSETLQSLRHPISNNSLSTEFDAGATIGLISSWKISVYLSNHSVPDRQTKWFIKITRTGGHPDATYFSCNASVKNKNIPNTDVVRVEMHRRQMQRLFGRIGPMMDSTVNDELDVHVEFELFPNCSLAAVDSAAESSYLFESAENSDCVIKVKNLDGGEGYVDFKAHTTVLAAGSVVFQKMLLDSGMKEQETGTVVIEDLSPDCVAIILKFLYTGKLDNDWKNVAEDMVTAVDMYNVPTLFEFINRNLHVVCTIANAQPLRRLATLHGLGIAVKNITKFIIENVHRIDLVVA